MVTAVIAAKYVLIPRGDAILPPTSSKVLKYVIESSSSELAQLVASRKFLKPSSISFLLLSNKPLYSTANPDGRVLEVRGGSVLTCRLAVATSGGLNVDCFRGIEGFWETPYGGFDISLSELEVVMLKHLSTGLSRVFRVEFLTPTVLTAKYMVPPSLKYKSKLLPERHRLIPQPSFIFSYLLRLWNSVAEPGERIPNESAGDWEAYKLGRLADVTLVEVDYRLRPATVVIGRDPRGRLRTARGFTGWVVYECLSKRLLPVYDKLLALATYLGIGRSRGIGFGMVRVENVGEPPTR